MVESAQQRTTKLIVTSGGIEPTRVLRSALRRGIPGSRIRSTGFRGVLAVEASGDASELGKLAYDECSQNVGHVTAVLAIVENKEESIRDAAVQIGAAEIGSEESFSFRLYKRGIHGMIKDTSTLEREIGGAIWNALEGKHQRKPKVNLKTPDITVIAEVLGPIAAIGISRREWREAKR